MKKHSFFVRYILAAATAGVFACMPVGLLADTTAAPEPFVAQSLDAVAERLSGADVIILGEVHDNGEHHRNQAALITALQPTAVVWEMITQQQADTLTPEVLQDAAKTSAVLNWEESGWPAFELYAPVFYAARQLPQFGALVPRAASQAALQAGVASHFGADAARFGLDQALPAAEQVRREADQLVNHCNAMPVEMLPMLVDFQRLRDTSLAAATERALQRAGGPAEGAAGGPVVVITGNGHARRDRGLSVYLTRAMPELEVLALGQSEEGRIEGLFDITLSSPAAPRGDPCLAFAKPD
ncbi:ChaN family lipoprotein [Pseudophaeobacter leonis]|uniref:ChaN family lipoprotein n=1 Tax=Pseudophaeobacter leonis TaxID=1144477 RepID=UPI0009F33193|nr:ChaN family lipoprotein [Pseudophaeobacter leonis]